MRDLAVHGVWKKLNGEARLGLKSAILGGCMGRAVFLVVGGSTGQF
jgi:hypothetical protein